MIIAGQCQCQAIQYQFKDCHLPTTGEDGEGVVGQVCICHCGMCRHVMGAPAAVAMALPRSKLQFVNNNNNNNHNSEAKESDDNHYTAEYPAELKEYKSSFDTRRYFCNTCGSSIVFSYDSEPNTIWIYVATLDESLQRGEGNDGGETLAKVLCQCASHICTNDRPKWYSALIQKQDLPSCPELELWNQDSCKK